METDALRAPLIRRGRWVVAMKETKINRLVGAIIGFIGCGIASLIILGLIVSCLDIRIQNLLPGSLIGASIGGMTGFFFPRLGEKFIEFMG